MSKIKLKVTFEIDGGDNVPIVAELKPHDYPQYVWARQYLFDEFFNSLKCHVLGNQIEILASNYSDALKAQLMASNKEKLEVYEQALKTFRVEVEEVD